ncbi:hydrogenase expression/formation protein [Siculibacillus lacustris]|uniref:Hydrogenase expression/formation protein n=1 Tax=Siculibacillus lacustris TaxID=1549641 RepID=A0A4Q9VUY9_9HYPH|nr:hydrogenase expression/formation protein [Siculibacillus lacustris]TBW40028.1 hydrogenase expression/formation protein [Siculibacillus lacustris]
MKAGFWVAPEGEEGPVAMLPIGAEAPAIGGSGLTGAGTISYLATASAEEAIARCPKVAALLPVLADALDAQEAAAPGRLFDLAELDDEERELMGQVLGTGEVSATVALPDGVVAQIRESVMAGLWRVRFEDRDGRPLADYVEVAAIPAAVERAATMTRTLDTIPPPPEGAMNVLPILTEIRDRAARHRPGDANHTLTFTLLPMSEADMAHLQTTLGPGPVQILSRGYGTCRIVATGVRDVWSVQYFNAMDTIVLDTLEIGGVPTTAKAAVEDFRDSAERLREIEEAYFR